MTRNYFTQHFFEGSSLYNKWINVKKEEANLLLSVDNIHAYTEINPSNNPQVIRYNMEIW
jgi:hypothetical protein